MIHIVFPVGHLGCNCSIFGDEATREAIVIDPGDDLPKITGALAEHHLKVKAIVITHGHLDHIAAAAELRKITQAPVYMNENDSEQLDYMPMMANWMGIETPERPEIDCPAVNGTSLRLGATDFHVILTPGHTQGSLCIWIPQEKKLVAGDTLFHETVGRTDLPGGDAKQLIASIKTNLYDLPDETAVFPGHGPATTLAHEKRFNLYLQGP